MPAQQKELPKAASEFHELRLKLAPPSLAERLWERVLTANERRRFGNDFSKAYETWGTVGIWMHLRQVSGPRAVIEVGQHLDLLSDAQAKWLLREIGERPGDKTASQRPSWCVQTGELWFRGKIVCKVRKMGSASNMQRILDAFEAAGWPTVIPNPLGTTDPQATHQAVCKLNKKLCSWRLSANEGTKILHWQVTSKVKSSESHRK